ncbi:signal peptidase I [Neobacillus sp. SCS-31]|uniref:signal peptidase I n=1 Tax=Neobacillus oceani TaxID=3115292 RepID=UPI00390606D8
MENKLRNLRKAMNSSTHKGIHFTEIHKKKIWAKLHQEEPTVKRKPFLRYYFVAFVAVSLFLLLFSQDITQNIFPNKNAELRDDITKPTIARVDAGSNTIVINYGIDNMDRGKYDFYSIQGEPKIVIEKVNGEDVRRGEIVYLKYPDDDGFPLFNPDYYLARVVGLPKETVEIKNGQVYINNKKLVAFYGEKTINGVTLETYLKRPKYKKSTLEESDFLEDMEPIKIPEATVFVLSDNWLRAVDSRHFGPLDMSVIEGKVLGYLKE